MKRLLNKYLHHAYGAYLNGLALFSRKKAAEKAFRLFCTPRKGKVLPQQKEYLNAAKDATLEVEGVRLQTYRWPGEKETVLLLHGWESNAFRWRKLIAELQNEGYTIIAFDAPAHGNSTGQLLNVPLYTECAQRVIEKYRPKHIIGHSVGGMTMMYHQYKYPNTYIDKMVSLAAPSEFSELMAHYQQLLNFNEKVLQALDEYILQRFGFRINDFSTSKFVQNITKKGLLVHDELDAITPIIASERVHAQWKNSTFIKTKGLGHSLHQEGVNKSIVSFLKS